MSNMPHKFLHQCSGCGSIIFRLPCSNFPCKGRMEYDLVLDGHICKDCGYNDGKK